MGDRLRDLLQPHLLELKSVLFPDQADEEALDEVVGRAVASTARLHCERDNYREDLEELARTKGAARAALTARNKRGYEGPGAVMALVDLAVSDRLRDPEASYQWADAAAFLAERDLKDRPSHQPLRARAWAEKGNAQRLREEFFEARCTLRRAEEFLGADHLSVFSGEIFSLLGSLETSVHRVDEALMYIDRALENFRLARLPTDQLLNKRALLLVYKGDLEPAVKDLVTILGTSLAQRECEPKRLIAGCHNALYALAEIALTTHDASERTQAVRLLGGAIHRLLPLYEFVDAPRGQARKLWLQGRMHLAAGDLVAAGEELEQAMSEFLQLDQAASAAVVSLDLALVLARGGDLAGVRETAAAACAIFESSGLEPDLWASVRVLEECQRVTEAEALIIEALKNVGGACLGRSPAVGQDPP